MAKVKATQFECSIEATEHMDNMYKLIQDPRMANWCNITDYNYNSKTADKLAKIRRLMDSLMEEMDNAC